MSSRVVVAVVVVVVDVRPQLDVIAVFALWPQGHEELQQYK